MDENGRRRSRRRSFSYPAFLDPLDGSSLIACRFSDVSQHGARVFLPNNDDLPVMVVLYLSATRTSMRECEIMWRSSEEMGLRFRKYAPVAQADRPAAATGDCGRVQTHAARSDA